MADLYDPYAAYQELTASDKATFDVVVSHGTSEGLTEAQKAAGIAAAFLLYRQYMRRKLLKEPRLTSEQLALAITRTWGGFKDNFKKMLLTYAVSEIAESLSQTSVPGVTPQSLLAVAESYADKSSQYLHEMSAKSVLKGFRAQLNVGVPPQVAHKRAVGAYGVPDQAMNSLVSSWTRDRSKDVRSTATSSLADNRARNDERIITSQVLGRARLIGVNEGQVLKNETKQVLWMFGRKFGSLPAGTSRKWVTARDELVCPTCGPMDKKTLDVEEKFAVPGGREVWGPPLHPGCRCDLVVNIPREAKKRLQKVVREEVLTKSAVSKARAGDPYDRDNSGKFASRESRFDTPQPARQSSGPAPRTAVTERQEMDTTLSSLLSQFQDLQADDDAPDLDSDFAPELEMASSPDLSLAPDLTVAPDLSQTPDLSVAPDLGEAPDLSQAPSFTEEKTQQPVSPVGHPVSRPVGFIIFPDYPFDEGDLHADGKRATIPDGTHMFLDVGADGKSDEIEYVLGEHWDDVREHVIASWRVSQSRRARSIYDLDSGNEYRITEESVNNAIDIYLSHQGDPDYMQEKLFALRDVTAEGPARHFSSWEILNQTDMFRELQDQRPTVLISDYLPEDMLPDSHQIYDNTTHRSSKWNKDRTDFIEGSGNDHPVKRTIWVIPEED